MAKCDVFLSYSVKDGREYSEILSQLLEEMGISVWIAHKMVTPGSIWVDQITEAISSCRYFIPIITEAYNTSSYAIDELSYAFESFQSRSKTILPIVATDTLSDSIQYYIGRIQWFSMDSAEELPVIADKIARLIRNDYDYESLYARIAEYAKLKNDNKEAQVICQLINLLSDQFQSEKSDKKRKEICQEIHRLYGRLEKYVGGYDAESRNTVDTIIKTLDSVSTNFYKSYDEGKPFLQNLFFCAFKIQMLYYDREIRIECADVITSGVVRDPVPVEHYIRDQKPYADAFWAMYSIRGEGNFSEEELSLIEATPRFIYDSAGKTQSAASPARSREHEPGLSKEDEILRSIAHFMQEGNKLFDILQEKRMEGSFLRCLLTSYERLKAYCQVVGASDVAAECVDRILEIQNLVERSPESKGEDGKAEKGIKSLLGFTLHGSGSYDVFISFKNEDSDLAEIIYNYCQKYFKEPFWSKRSLPELSASEYEDAIFDALRKSKHFVIVLSKIEYLQESWIKKEMATFDRAITEGRKEGGNFLFVVTDDVYDYIIRSNKMCLDERYCGYQIIKMSEYESILYKYL